MQSGSHERAWCAAGGVVLTGPGVVPMVLATPGLPPVLVLPAVLTVPREVLFGWARSELGVQRCGWLTSFLRLRVLVEDRHADRLADEDVA